MGTLAVYPQIDIKSISGDRPGSLHYRFERSNFKQSLLDNPKKPVKSRSEEPDPAGKKAFFIQRAIASKVREGASVFCICSSASVPARLLCKARERGRSHYYKKNLFAMQEMLPREFLRCIIKRKTQMLPNFQLKNLQSCKMEDGRFPQRMLWREITI